MVKQFGLICLFLGAFSLPANAAEEWGIDGEVKARFEAKVVDIQCELTGNCPDNCGSGKRQLGLLRETGELVMVLKNFTIFAGGTDDLIPYCNKQIIADGLMITTPHMPMFALQFTKLADGGKWSRANGFAKSWSKRNSGKDASNWFRDDQLVQEIIAKDGVFGIPGLEPEE